MRLVTLGDSITGITDYSYRYAWPPFLTFTPELLQNAGIGGDNTAQMLARLDTDVIAYRPTDVTIMGGTNDIYAGALAPFAWSMDNIGQIIDRVKAAGATAWLLTIPPFSTLPYPPSESGVPIVEAYNTALALLAASHGARLVNTWAAVAGSNGDWLPGYSADGIHANATAAPLFAAAVQLALLAPIVLSTDVITAWVTSPAGIRLVDLDRSTMSPYRRFAFSWERHAAGACSLQYALGSDVDGTGFAKGNLIWMSYRGKTRVYVSRGRKVGLTRDERGSDWVTVTGVGARSLLRRRLVFPTAFDPTTTAGRTPSTWGTDAQWRRFVNRAAGEMLWDMISESASRFPVAITRGAVETTGVDGWTQDFRFETIGDVMAAVEAAYGDVDLVGDPATGNLVFNYYNAIGTDRSASVIFEEGADLRGITVDETAGPDQDTPTWIVGQGAGEGIIVPELGVADSLAADRVEAYLDVRDAKTAAMVQTQTDAALAEQSLLNGTSMALEVSEDRWLAITDYGEGDTVRVISTSRNVDEGAQIVALYVHEDDDERVHVSFDLGSPRTADDLKAAQRQQATARSLGVTNRQPQGQLVPFPISGRGVFDDTESMIVGFTIPTRMTLLIETMLTLDFDQYWAPAKTAGNNTAFHNHILFGWQSGTAGGYGLDRYSCITAGPPDRNIDLATDSTGDIFSADETTPHTHALTYGIYKETYPASHSVNLKVYKLITGAWVQQGATITGLTAGIHHVDLTAYVTGAGDWRVEIKSAAAQPNGGRLAVTAQGYALGAIQSS